MKRKAPPAESCGQWRRAKNEGSAASGREEREDEGSPRAGRAWIVRGMMEGGLAAETARGMRVVGFEFV